MKPLGLFISGILCFLIADVDSFGPPNLDFDFEGNYLSKRNHVNIRGLKCGICDEIVRGSHFLWSMNMTQDCVAGVIAYFCKKLPIHVDNSICGAITSEFRVTGSKEFVLP